ncbi:PREDICTED: cytochrome c oxidase subunit 7C, mitochondrial [Corvus brachyrhynchos]|nr:PREDICTED: cytochrome c oxidase subunit 7C, mitochondrial [Corvus brachyrhynchos]
MRKFFHGEDDEIPEHWGGCGCVSSGGFISDCNFLFFFQNLPFSVDNKWRLLAMMCAFFGSGFGAPFLIVRHQLLKK